MWEKETTSLERELLSTVLLSVSYKINKSLPTLKKSSTKVQRRSILYVIPRGKRTLLYNSGPSDDHDIVWTFLYVWSKQRTRTSWIFEPRPPIIPSNYYTSSSWRRRDEKRRERRRHPNWYWLLDIIMHTAIYERRKCIQNHLWWKASTIPGGPFWSEETHERENQKRTTPTALSEVWNFLNNIT